MQVQWPSAACQTMTAGLLAKMTRQQKAAQMVMAPNPTTGDITTNVPGAVFAPGGGEPPSGTAPTDWATMTDGYYAAATKASLGIPILYGLDAVHGDNGPTGTVIFPHNAGLASSRDAAFVTQVEQITAAEARATGVTWVFAPFMGVAWDDRWGRTYESYSEDPQWASEMALAAVQGLQGTMGPGSGSPGLVACAKHWAGDGQATAGTSSKGGVVDRGNVEITQAQMEQYGIAPYVNAIQAGLGCIMVSDARWNGASMTSSSQLITTLLKGMYGFKGFVVTDWQAADTAGGIPATINAGVDMLMEPNGWQAAIGTIANATTIPDSRIDDAVTRILNTKCQAGMFSYARDASQLASVGSPEHRAVGRKAVAQSLVVLQNSGGVLPLAKTSKVWVGGTGANSLDKQCGGWTISWQGNGGKTQGTTIQQAIGKVTTLAPSMSAADVVVVALSETKNPYAEFVGDSTTLNTLDPTDVTTLSQARASGKKVVALVVSGRPTLITSIVMNADAWIAAWLPGTEGDGVADVLFGDVKPTGKLSHSWPRDDTQANVMTCCNGNYNPLFALGTGLTY
jgi:beta-glucosidase